MAITILNNQEVNKPKSKKSKTSRQREKLNIREFTKEHPDCYGVGYPVIKGKVTDSGWLIIETTEWVGFIHAGSSVAENLIDEILPGLHGTKANTLVGIPNKANKYGFVLGVDDESQHWYNFDSEDESFSLSENKDKSEGKQQQLTLNMFTATKSTLDISGDMDLITDNKPSSKAKQRALDGITSKSSGLNGKSIETN